MPSKSLSQNAGSSNDHAKSLGGSSNNSVVEPFQLPDLEIGSGVTLGGISDQTVTIGGNGSATLQPANGGSVAPALDNPLALGDQIDGATGSLPFSPATTPGNVNLLELPLSTNGTPTLSPNQGGLVIGDAVTTTDTSDAIPAGGTIVGQSADGQTIFIQQTPGGPILPFDISGGMPTTPAVPTTTLTPSVTTDPTMTTGSGQLTFPIDQGTVVVSDMIQTGEVQNAAADFGPFAAFAPTDAELTTQFSGTANGDSIDGTRDDDLIEGNNGNDRLEGRFGNDLILGGNGGDRIRGDEGDDRIFGGDGNDDINGNEGDDLIFGEDGDDKLNGDRNDDIVDGGLGDDYLQGEGGDDAVLGGAGNDVLLGGLGDDLLAGGPGDDQLDGGSGDDVLHGGDGDDTIISGSGMNIVDGSAGMDTISAQEGSNILFGGLNDDSIEALEGTAMLFGGSGNDILMGGMATSILAGGRGDDVMNAGMGDGIHIGGAGSDMFVIGSDVIGNGMVDRVAALDFTSGEDTLEVSQTVLDSITSIENTVFDLQPMIQPFLDAGLNSDQSFDRMTLVASSDDFQDDLMFLLDTQPNADGELNGHGVLLSNAEGDQIFVLNVWAEELGLQTTDDSSTV